MWWTKFRLFSLSFLLMILHGCSGGSSGPGGTAEATAVHFDAPNTQNIFPLNDTGRTLCVGFVFATLDCSVAGLLPQDGMYGRDFEDTMGVLAKLGNGPGGFDFLKLDSNGMPLIDQNSDTAQWSCVHDAVTELTWEVKTTDGELRDAAWFYSWYLPDDSKNGGMEGYQSDGNCGGILCDTNSYVDAVNATNLCGYNDWRLPTKEELHSIVEYREFGYQSLPRFYFPNELDSWSSTTQADEPGRVWVRSTGYFGIKGKEFVAQIRLVRSDY